MGNIPDDIKSGMQNLAKASKTDTKVLVEELKQIIASDETIKSMPPEQEEFKIRYAWALLCRRHTSTGSGQMYIKLLSESGFNKTKIGKSRASVNAMIRRITEDEEKNTVIGEVEIASGTLWEKAAEAVCKISKNKVYKVSLTMKELKCQQNNSSWEGVGLGGNDATFIETTETTFPTNEEFYKSFIEPKEKDIKIDLDEGDLNSRSNDIDIRVVKVMIIDGKPGRRADGSEYGQYVVTDDSMLGGGEGGKPGSYTWWIAPSEVIFEKGVTMKGVVTSSYDKVKNKVNWNYFFGIPIGTAVKRKIEIKHVEKPTESINPDDLDDDIQAPAKNALEDDFAI